jgi:hypothetical protein
LWNQLRRTSTIYLSWEEFLFWPAHQPLIRPSVLSCLRVRSRASFHRFDLWLVLGSYIDNFDFSKNWSLGTRNHSWCVWLLDWH